MSVAPLGAPARRSLDLGVSDLTAHPDAVRVRHRSASRFVSRLAYRAGARLRGEGGFSLIEMTLAAVIFVGVATALVGVLVSSISAHGLARDRTRAEQWGNDHLESIRRLDYDDVGTEGGNPPGTVWNCKDVTAAGQDVSAGGHPCGTPPSTAQYRIRTQISYVADPAPTSYDRSSNYKKVTVTVTRLRDNRQFAQYVTNVAPPARAPFGGINYAVINATVVDYKLRTPMVGATVGLSNGPSPNRTDVTNTEGTATFAALTANPAPPSSQAYYDLLVSGLTGYETIKDDKPPPGGAVPPAGPGHIQLAPSQTANTTLQVFLPATINAILVGNPGTTRLMVKGARKNTWNTFNVTGGSWPITDLDGEKVVPGVVYTLRSAVPGTGGFLCADPTPREVPDNYPTVLSSSFNLNLAACPLALTVNVRRSSGNPVSGATVKVTIQGWIDAAAAPLVTTGTTNASGQVTFNVPAGPATAYNVEAWKGGETHVNTNVTPPGTVNLTLASGTIRGRIIRSGANYANAPVTLTGGPGPVTLTTTSTTAGGTQVNYTITDVPVGSGYTVVATVAGCNGSSPNPRSGKRTGVGPVTAGGTLSGQNVTINVNNTCTP
jgi:type II secretory pathway pseudopilin PulG